MPEADTFRERIRRRLEAFSGTRRGVDNAALACRLGALAFGVGLFALLALGGHVPNAFVNLALFVLAALALAGLAGRYLLKKRRFRSHLDEAFRMEDLRGGLNSRLVSALDFSREPRPSPLMEVVLRRAEGDLEDDFGARIDRSARNRLALRLAISACLFLGLGLTPWFGFARVYRNLNETFFAVRDFLFPVIYEVSPPCGRHIYPLGKAVRVEIAFATPGFRQVTLVRRRDDRRVRHVLDVDGSGRAGMAIEADVESEHRVHFEFGRRKSGEVRLVFADRPALENMQTELVYPPYTRMLPRTLEGMQERLFALAGTRITLGFTFSKALARASLTFDDGEELPLETVGRFASTAIVHSRPRRASLQVEDVHGFRLADPIEIGLEVQQDEKPRVFLPNTLKREMPVLADGLKLFGFGVRLKDDFGLNRCVLSWTRSTLNNPGTVTQRGQVERLISPPRAHAVVSFQKVFEGLPGQPGDRITFRVEAYDNRAPQNQKTRSASRSLFVYQQGLEDFQIAKLGFGGAALMRARIAKSKRAAGVQAPLGAKTTEKIWNEFEAKIDSVTRPQRITGPFAPAVRDYFRLLSTAVRGEESPPKPSRPGPASRPARPAGEGAP